MSLNRSNFESPTHDSINPIILSKHQETSSNERVNVTWEDDQSTVFTEVKKEGNESTTTRTPETSYTPENHTREELTQEGVN